MNESLLGRLQPVATRFRSLRFWQMFAVVAILACGIGWYAKSRADAGQIDGETAAVVLGAVVAGLAVAAGIAVQLAYRDPKAMAKRVEQQFPSLDQRLITALAQKDDELGFLQQRVIKEARDHSRSHRWADTVSGESLWYSRLSGLGAGVGLAAVLGLLAGSNPDRVSRAASSQTKLRDVLVEPGNVEVERGTSLVITAEFPTPKRAARLESDPPADKIVIEPGELILRPVDGGSDGQSIRLPMTQNLSDPILGGFVASVSQKMTYRIETPTWESQTYSIDVFDYPSVERVDAVLEFPEYTGLPTKTVADTVRVSAVIGTDVTWNVLLNKPVQQAELVGPDQERVAMTLANQPYSTATIRFPIEKTARYQIELLDTDGRTNKIPTVISVRALPNRSPKIKVTPATDTSVSPLEEYPVSAEVLDDFGVSQFGLSYTLDGGEPQDIVLSETVDGGIKFVGAHLFALEDIGAEPDQLLAYSFYASDVGPDGQPRRTDSDMYFATVRPFEEIFREGEPPPGGQPPPPSESAAKADELSELQKEIINATWRLQRDHRGKPGDSFEPGLELILESQNDAIDKLAELETEVRDAKSKAFVEEARGAMNAAVTSILEAKSDRSASPLADAVASEQSAYAGLLKLRSREYQIVKSQQQNPPSASSASQQRKQQKLDELELDQDENRYEMQSQAQAATAEEAAQQEVRQLLSRLKDLARRQEDLNKEVAQLQTALENAATEEEKEQIRRQLKRLRDQQEEILRETDEMAERMDSSPSGQADPESKSKLEETRENVRKAAEALEQEDASEALAAGKRAETEFEEMRDEFRQKAAGQFGDAVRQMRRAAQDLDQQQQELGEKMRESETAQPSAGLRNQSPRGDLQSELESQTQELEKLLEQMQQTVEESEEAEPLLAQKLYDSYRGARQRGVDRDLKEASELLERGFDPQAASAQQQAGEGISQLREELEDAAESVLGDQTKALARALGELERLEKELDREVRDNLPQKASPNGKPGQNGEPGQQAEPGQESQPGQVGNPSGDESGQSPSPSNPGERPQDSPESPSQQSQQQQSQQKGGGMPGQSQGENPQDREGQPSGNQPLGDQPPGDQPPSGQQPGNQPGQGSENPTGRPTNGAREGGSPMNRFAADSPSASPITGDGFRPWSDALREVEEMVDDPDLRSQAAQIRDRAREMRIDFKRHSKEPNWDLVDQMIATPLRELKRNVSEELMRQSADRNAIVPIDRDPVPGEFVDAIRQYYESLGGGRP